MTMKLLWIETHQELYKFHFSKKKKYSSDFYSFNFQESYPTRSTSWKYRIKNWHRKHLHLAQLHVVVWLLWILLRIYFQNSVTLQLFDVKKWRISILILKGIFSMLCVVFSMLYDDIVDCHKTYRLHMIRIILYLVNMYLFAWC